MGQGSNEPTPTGEVQKGSIEWFNAITDALGERLVGIEVLHHSHDEHLTTPQCEVKLVLSEFIYDIIPEEVISLRSIKGYSLMHWTFRGDGEGKLRTSIFFRFWGGEECPRETMLEAAEALGFTAAPKFLNSKHRTARFSPSIYEEA